MTRDARRRPAVFLAILSATTMATLGLATGPASAATTEYIKNGTFASSTDPWWGTENLKIAVSNGSLCTQVPAKTTNVWDAIVGHSDIPLVSGSEYTLKFSASASVATKIKANVQLAEDPYTATLSRDTALTTSMKTFTYTFTSSLDSDGGSLQFQIGGSTKAWRFCLDNVSLTSKSTTVTPSGKEQVTNGKFDDGDNAWYTYGTDSASADDGKMCAEVPGDLENPWDAGVGQNDIPLVEGSKYTFSFEASASSAASIRASVQLGEDPYTSYFNKTISLGTTAKKFSYTFTADESVSNAQVAFQIGGTSSPYTFCVDNVSLRGGA